LPHCSHPNIIRFIGLGESTTEEDKVEGMVIEYIDNAKSLEDVDCITMAQCERWTREIRSAIEYLHGKGFLWGDAKAGNILIGESGRPVLLDFGGGFSRGWVELQNSETVKGDWQGFDKIIEFMKNKTG
jgi:serine/threonine protein kinase